MDKELKSDYKKAPGFEYYLGRLKEIRENPDAIKGKFSEETKQYPSFEHYLRRLREIREQQVAKKQDE